MWLISIKVHKNEKLKNELRGRRFYDSQRREKREREQVTREVIKFGYTFPIDLDDEEEAALSRHFSLWMGGFKWNSKSTKK